MSKLLSISEAILPSMIRFPASCSQIQVKEYIMMNPEIVNRERMCFITGDLDKHLKMQGEHNLYRLGKYSLYLAESGYFQDDQAHGILQTWHENRQIKSTGNYINGKSDGIIQEWHENGQLAFKGNYTNGKADGLQKQYYENGQKKFDGNFINDKPVFLHKEYYENGQKKSEQNYLDGNTNGLKRIWYENGQLNFTGHYIDGEANGFVQSWHKNNQLKSSGQYINGKEDGAHISWDSSGRILSEQFYQNGVKCGTHKTWAYNSYDQKQLRSITDFKENKIHGLRILWSYMCSDEKPYHVRIHQDGKEKSCKKTFNRIQIADNILSALGYKRRDTVTLQVDQIAELRRRLNAPELNAG